MRGVSRSNDFVTRCKRVAKQALGRHAGEPASGGFVRWVHVTIHCLRMKKNTPIGRLQTGFSTMGGLWRSRDRFRERPRVHHDLPLVRSLRDARLARVAARQRAAAASIEPRCHRQHVLRSVSRVASLRDTRRSRCRDAESHRTGRYCLPSRPRRAVYSESPEKHVATRKPSSPASPPPRPGSPS